MPAKLPTRVADYYCVVGVDQPLSQGGVLEPGLLQRYPAKDFDDAEFPRDLQLFCFPNGFYPEQADIPERTSTFVLTEADGARVYCTSLTFYERQVIETENSISVSSHTSTGSLASTRSNGQVSYVPKCLMITSHWPFLNQFSEFLLTLYRETIQPRKEHLVPMERIISNFIDEVPLPPTGKIEVIFQPRPSWSQVFRRPPPNKLPMAEFDMMSLFRCIRSPENVMKLISAVLTERRLLFVSSEAQRLTMAAEALNALIYPFRWQHIYIPVLPSKLIDFVCAPMPFFCGVLTEYLPDELLLEGCCIVELDDDLITVIPSEPVPPLPEKAAARLTKTLKSKMGNDQEHIRSAFLQFFVKILKHYVECMEPPSENVIDRFDKEKFMKLVGPSDKQFYQQFLDTQLFQCFVDERYDVDVKSGEHMELLFFEEWMQEQAKSDFLQDSSFDHVEKFQVLAPNQEDLDQEFYEYAVYPEIHPERFGTPRQVEPLVSAVEKVKTGASLNMDSTYMEYFKRKLLYQRHFHSLQERTSKQDLVFKNILDLVREHQTFDVANRYTQMCLNQYTNGIKSCETGTTLDRAWEQLRDYLIVETKGKINLARRLENNMFNPLIKKVDSNEKELNAIFQEARDLERYTSQQKNIVEGAKSRNNNMQRRFEQVVMYSSKLLSDRDISRVVNAKYEADDARLRFEEESTCFRAVYENHEKRMPAMIRDVRRLNGERITTYKQTIREFVRAKRHLYRKLMKNLDELEKVAGDIDVEKDVATFEGNEFEADNADEYNETKESPNEGNPASVPEDSESDGSDMSSKYRGNRNFSVAASSVTRLAKRTLAHTRERSRSMGEVSGIGSAPISPKARKDIAISHPLLDRPLYAVDLWSPKGFDWALQQAMDGRATLKALMHTIEDWASVWDTKSKLLNKLLKNTPEVVEPSWNYKTTQNTSWRLLVANTQDQANWYSKVADQLKSAAVQIRIAKGFLKNVQEILKKHRVALSKELQNAKDNVVRAHEKRNQALQAFQQAQQHYEKRDKDFYTPAQTPHGLLELREALMAMEKCDLAYRRATHAWTASKEQKYSMQIKYDISSAYMLDMFQDREHYRVQVIRETLQTVSKCLKELFDRLEKTNDGLKQAVSKLNAETDLHKFVADIQSKWRDVPDDRVLHGHDPVDFYKHIGDDSSFPVILQHANQGVDVIRVFITFLDERFNASEHSTRLLKKYSATFEMEPMKEDHHAPSLRSAIEQLQIMLTSLVGLSEQNDSKKRATVYQPLVDLKRSHKKDLMQNEKMFHDAQAQYDDKKDVLERAKEAQHKSASALAKAQKKLNTKDEQPTSKSKKMLSKILKKTEEQLTAKEASARMQSQEAMAQREAAIHGLSSERTRRNDAVKDVYSKVKDLSRDRVDIVRQKLLLMIENDGEEYIVLGGMVDSLEYKTREISPEADITEFLRNHINTSIPPACVLNHLQEQMRHKPVETRSRDSSIYIPELDALKKDRSFSALSRALDVLPESEEKHSSVGGAFFGDMDKSMDFFEFINSDGGRRLSTTLGTTGLPHSHRRNSSHGGNMLNRRASSHEPPSHRKSDSSGSLKLPPSKHRRKSASTKRRSLLPAPPVKSLTAMPRTAPIGLARPSKGSGSPKAKGHSRYPPPRRRGGGGGGNNKAIIPHLKDNGTSSAAAPGSPKKEPQSSPDSSSRGVEKQKVKKRTPRPPKKPKPQNNRPRADNVT